MPILAERKDCTGCTACAAVCPKNCIAMTADADGFRFPAADESACVGCGLCEKTCPVLTGAKVYGNPAAFAACSRDEALRAESSSGGVFSELSREILADGGAVYGAAYDENFNVTHICATDEGGLGRLRGAKYAQSELGNTFFDVKKMLEQGRQVLFSGTPCQVAGLKSCLRKGYENLTTVDFVCHGVPSPMVWQKYVEYRAAEDNGGAAPRAINLRSKETGWSRYRYSNLFEYENGTRHLSASGESLLMKLFVGGYVNRESCENCRFKGYARVSDLTIGDFWGIWDIAPEMDDDRGTSLVLCQSEKGAALLERIAPQLRIKQVTLEEASRQNPSLLFSFPARPDRAGILETIRGGKIGSCAALFTPQKPTPVQRVKNFVRRIARKLLNS